MGIYFKKGHTILFYDAGQFYVNKTRWRPNKNLWNFFAVKA